MSCDVRQSFRQIDNDAVGQRLEDSVAILVPIEFAKGSIVWRMDCKNP